MGENYLTSPVNSQKTIAHNDRFFTYYRSGEVMKAASTPVDDGENWSEVNHLSGIPNTIRLSSLTTSGTAIYALDEATGWIYQSSNGVEWDPISTDYEVVALYGEIPRASAGNILLAVNNDGVLTFAQTDDFSEINLMNNIPENIPVNDFSAMKVESASSYASQFIFLSGGTTATNTLNNDIWILQEDEGIITHITSKKPEDGSLQGSSLFFYDDQPYLITVSAEKNLLMHSENFGVEWINAGANQAFPDDFTARRNASVITDANNYIWIFGGISLSNNPVTDIWRGRLNKFAEN